MLGKGKCRESTLAINVSRTTTYHCIFGDVYKKIIIYGISMLQAIKVTAQQLLVLKTRQSIFRSSENENFLFQMQSKISLINIRKRSGHNLLRDR